MTQFEENSSSCAIDGLTVICKRVTPNLIADTNANTDEVALLVQSILEAELSRSELEKLPSLFLLWVALCDIAKSLSLGRFFLSQDLDYSGIPVHIARFVGAFLSTYEFILEQNSTSIKYLSNLLFDIFAESDKRHQDIVIQLLKEYKDWFPYSYMFNRKIGRNPKSSFDQVNWYLNSQKHVSDSSSLLEKEEFLNEQGKENDDDDTFDNSFTNDNFLNVSAPGIQPLKPYAEDLSQSVESQESPLHQDESVSSNQEFILKSYYNYTSDWRQNKDVVDEDEDSDRDSSTPLQKPPSRLTRMKANNNSRSRNKRPKKSNYSYSYNDDDSSPDSISRVSNMNASLSSATSGKVVSFASEEKSDNLLLQSSDSIRGFDEIDEYPSTKIARFDRGTESLARSFDEEVKISATVRDSTESQQTEESLPSRTPIPIIIKASTTPSYEKGENDSDLDLSDSERLRKDRDDPRVEQFKWKTSQLFDRSEKPPSKMQSHTKSLPVEEEDEEEKEKDNGFIVGESRFPVRKEKNLVVQRRETEVNEAIFSRESQPINGPLGSLPAPKINARPLQSDKSHRTRRSGESMEPQQRRDQQSIQDKVAALRKRKALQSSLSEKKTEVSESTEKTKKQSSEGSVSKVERRLLPASVIKKSASLLSNKHTPPPSLALTSEEEEEEVKEEAAVPYSVTTPLGRPALSLSQDFFPSSSEYLRRPQPQTIEGEEEESFARDRQSLAIVNLSLSMNRVSYLHQPFQELPSNLSFPPLSEFALQSGVIFESFLEKKSSSLLGQWQRRYFVFKESPVHFCELQIYYQATESMWGVIPLHLKCSIPILDIISVESHGTIDARGREFVVRYTADSSRKSLFSLPSFFRSSKAKSSSFSQEVSDSDQHSENDSVNSFGADSREGKTREILLQADDAQTRLMWVTLMNKALKAVQLELLE